jgi:hypothetical protein
LFFHTQRSWCENPDDYTLGQAIGPEIFAIGEKVNVTGISKGADLQALLNAMGSTVDGRPTAAIATGGPDLSSLRPN